MGIAEILAAKKAKQQASANTAVTTQDAIATASTEVKKDIAEVMSKSLTFAEKLALKKQGQQESTQEPPQEPVKEVPKEPEVLSLQKNQPAHPVDITDSLQYSDISARIAELSALADLELKSAMSELKKSLMQNPAAVSLMSYEDIGKLVDAFNRITGAYLEVEKEKETKPRKSKEVKKPLTPEEIEEAFNEL